MGGCGGRSPIAGAHDAHLLATHGSGTRSAAQHGAQGRYLKAVPGGAGPARPPPAPIRPAEPGTGPATVLSAPEQKERLRSLAAPLSLPIFCRKAIFFLPINAFPPCPPTPPLGNMNRLTADPERNPSLNPSGKQQR